MASMRGFLAVVGLLMFIGCKSKDGLGGDGGPGTDDAASATCGNGMVDDNETCDGDCPSCDDNNACTIDMTFGSAETCDVSCGRSVITACGDGDGCCPAGCTTANDDDCSASCGNGNIDANETCDPPGTCPTACNDGDACTNDLMTGSPANCNAACSTSDITACTNGDGCCPNGCNATNDSDCSASCGNGVIEGNETCDPKASCPTSCNDNDACTTNVLTGDMSTCNAVCSYPAITTCTNGDGCCPSGCTFSNDDDCPPPMSTPLDARIVTTNITAPAGVKTGDGNWRIWGSSSLNIAPVFTIPFADCGTLVGYTTTTSGVHTARVARLDANDQIVTTHDLGTFVLRGLAAEPDGNWGALLWEQKADIKTNQLHVRRYNVAGAQQFTAALPNAAVAPDDFNIGESRLEYDPPNNRYGAYFHVHGVTQFVGHEGDMLQWVAKANGAITNGWTWGCSHSMSELLRYSPAASSTLPVCATDCFPGTSGTDFANNSIGGIYLNHNSVKVRDFNAGCNGRVATELGGAAPGVAGWKLVFNGHQNAATLGQSSYDVATMNQDIGFQAIANNRSLTGSIVWLTSTSGTNESNSSIARWQPMGDTTEQYVVGWTSAPTGGTYHLARINATGGFLEGPLTITTAKWGRRDDPFRTHLNGDIVWAWFDTAGSSTLRFARLVSGGTATCPQI